ncbi:Hsp70 family protein [Cetobacterium sp.]|uniref:Hsp70 family protein n=1 Tax=Cetobacterium sp. TaxID=2071632 RepID=UPI003F3E879C
MNLIGIDLGTTTSEVAIYKNGNSEIIKNIKEGDTGIIPSVVLIENDQTIIGVKAKNQMILKPRNVVSEVKRLMGTNKKLKIDGKVYSPLEISSMILKKIKEIAEFYLGEEIDEAVITVPANFNNKARKETKEAGEKIGLKINRIINEPTAAAIAYGINNEEEDANILVYDFGGGTIDVTVLELFDGVLDVKSSRGNNEIGGKDIDKELMKYLIKEFKRETGESLNLKDLRIVSALKKASEECKINLAFHNEWDVILPYIGKDKEGNTLDMNITIDRKILNDLSKDIINETEKIIDEALDGAELNKEDIDKVILVGGSTRLIDVKNLIKKKFGRTKIISGINPEETVAIGAAIQCAIKNKVTSKAIVVTDVCSHSLGVEVLGGKFDSIIERDSKLPNRVTKLYKTAEDYQTEANINIYQGENKLVEENIFLGRVEIENIPRNKKGKEVMEITFKYDLNGILDTKVKVISTGDMEKKSFKEGKNIIERNETEEDAKEKLRNKRIKEKIKKRLEEEKAKDFEEDIDKEELIIENEGENLEQDILDREKVDSINIEDDFVKLDVIDMEKDIVEETIIEVEDSEKEEIKIEKNEEEKNEKESEGEETEEEEEDYSNMDKEVVNVVQYANSKMEGLDLSVQNEVRNLFRDLLPALNNSQYKECREIEEKILNLVGVD